METLVRLQASKIDECNITDEMIREYIEQQEGESIDGDITVEEG